MSVRFKSSDKKNSSPNPFSFLSCPCGTQDDEKGLSCRLKTVPLFLREGFSQRDAFGKGELLNQVDH